MTTLRDWIRPLPGVRWAAKLHREHLAHREWRTFHRSSQQTRPDLRVDWQDRFLCLTDRTTSTPFEPHYTYHTAWAARRLSEIKPAGHIDISSSLFFVGIASAFVPMTHFDYRAPAFHIDGVTCQSGDLTALPLRDNSVPSLSCMHVVEHVGLGRYGDPLDPVGDIKAASELQRVLEPGGHLLFVAPVGSPRVCFNAHRIYSFRMVMDLFPSLQLTSSALVADNSAAGLIPDPEPALFDAQSYGCGCFHFTKPSSPVHG